jgi:rod shape-determining protein MreC
MAGSDHAPPPFFKRGPAPLALLTFYIAITLALFVVDLRLKSLDLLRQSVALVTDPIQRIAQTPGSLVDNAAVYLKNLDQILEENQRLKQSQLRTANDLQRLEHLTSENERLRKLLLVKEREKAVGQVASIMYTARDPFSRKVVVDKGLQSGVEAGQAVIDEAGVVGQVTRVFPLSAEITLITDKDQAVPVQVLRTGQRSVVFGTGDGQVELRYLPANADIQEGDLLVTSGLDSTYLPGFPVARIASIEHGNAYAFARIRGTPTAAVENFGEILILAPRQAQPGPPPEAPGRNQNTGVPKKEGKK